MSRPKRVVLLADSNAINRSCWMLVLETHGYRVLCAASTDEALAWIELSPDPHRPGVSIDVVVAVTLDYGLNGRELARRAFDLRPDLRVMLFGRGSEGRIDDTVCAAFLPAGVVNAFTLLERIKVLTARKRGPKGVRAGRARELECEPVALTTQAVEGCAV